MSRDEAIDLIGPPYAEDGDILGYDGWRPPPRFYFGIKGCWTMTVTYKEGKIVNFRMQFIAEEQGENALVPDFVVSAVEDFSKREGEKKDE